MKPEYPFRARLFARNTALLFLAHFVARGLGFLSGIVLANYLDVERFGLYSFALAFPLLFLPLYDLGIDTLITREIATGSEVSKQQERTALGLKLVLSTAGILALMTAALILPYNASQRPFVGMGILIVILRTYPSTHFGIFRGHQRMELETHSTILGKSVEFAILIGAVLAGADLAWIFWLLLVTSVGQILYTQWLARRAGLDLRLSLDLAPVKALVRAGLPFAATAIALQVTQQIAAVLLGFISGEEAVGLYRSAQNLTFGFSSVVAAIAAALLPALSQLHRSDPAQARRLASLSLSLALAIGLPLAVVTTILAEPIIGFLYASSYAPAQTTLSVIIWWIPLMYGTTILGTILGAIRRQQLFLIAAAVGALFHILLCATLIPIYSHIGAAVAVVAAEGCAVAILLWFVKREFGVIPTGNTPLRILAAQLSFVPLVFLGPTVHVLISLAAACILYTLGLLLSGALSRDRLGLLRNLPTNPDSTPGI
jgi:O-antigen/teichoic acid export membrane protein